MGSRIIRYCAMGLALVVGFACSPETGAPEPERSEADAEQHDGSVVLSPEELKEFGVEVAVAGPGSIAWPLSAAAAADVRQV